MTRTDDEVLRQVTERLGLYVYLLVDPRDSRPFYVGKGRGVRMHAHGLEADDVQTHPDGTKVRRIRDIRSVGLEPEIWIARYAMTGVEYTAVEAVLIDVLSSFPIVASNSRYRPLARRDELTNARREDAAGKGMVLLDRLVDELAAPELIADDPLLLVALKPWTDQDETVAGGRTRPGHGFKAEWVEPRERDLTKLEMSTTSWWKLSPEQVRRRGIEHAVAVFRGVTRGLFAIDDASWEQNASGRWAFVGTPVTAGDLFDRVLGLHGYRVPARGRGNQNPIMYWPRR